MPRRTDEDLFKESTMTFGEHLEELRSCLFKSLLGLALGFVVGLFFAFRVGNLIQTPLTDALVDYYKVSAVEDIEEQLEQLAKEGLPLPGTAEQLAELVTKHNVLPEQVFVHPTEVFQQLDVIYGRERAELADAAEQFRRAESLLDRLKRRSKTAKEELGDDERDRLLEALDLLEPVSPAADNSNEGLTQEDQGRLVEAARAGQPVSQADLTRIAAALQGQKERVEEDLARMEEAIALFGRAAMPAKRPQEKLTRGDLASIYIWRPIEEDSRINPQSLGAHEPFTIFVKAGLVVGALMASPWIFLQIWSFVAAGLYHHERKFIYVFLPASLILFALGAATAFLFVLKPVLNFLFYFNEMLNIDPKPRITEWLSFVLILPLGFGIAFQLPLVMLFLERIGVFTVDTYLSKWRIAILVIFVLAMFLTPADPQSMLLMAIPLTVLYFGGVLLCRMMPRRRSPYDEEED